MKIKLLVWICFFTSIGFHSCKKIDFIEVQNNEAYLVKDKLVYLSRNNLNTESKGYLQFQDEKGNKFPSQFVDTDYDGNWDKVSLLVSLPANGKIKVTYKAGFGEDKFIIGRNKIIDLVCKFKILKDC